MDLKKIEEATQNYLLGESTDSFIKNFSPTNNFEKFKYNTIKRLISAFELYNENSKYLFDFLISLRNYLLVFDTSVKIPEIFISQDNPFGLSCDACGNIYASFLVPEYLSEHSQKFVKEGFNERIISNTNDSITSNLQTSSLIYKLTGYRTFKTMAQKLAVIGANRVPKGYTSLIGLPTGGGKSLITQSIAYSSEGLTIVIIPTVSLAIDQVRAAKNVIKHNTDNEIFQYTSNEAVEPIIEAIENKTIRLLFISPETLINNPLFRQAIDKANKNKYLKNIIIDEAHIVSEWGESFRIEFQCLESWRANLIQSNSMLRTFLLSATFEGRVVSLLKKLFCTDQKWVEVRCDSLRSEPRYVLTKSQNYTEKMKKFVDLVCKLPHPLIVYVINPEEAENVNKILNDNGIHNTRMFTGKTSSKKRKELIKDWIDDKFDIMIATNAFGVGVDKGDVRSVLHMYVPQTPSAYYQELGRGGRDGLPCLSILNVIISDRDKMRQRINKQVLTTRKIIDRWMSMIDDETTIKENNLYYIKSTVLPKYREFEVLFETYRKNDIDENWNIYVLLLLRRYDLISIKDVIVDKDSYIFMIEVNNQKLFFDSEDLEELIEQARNQETRYKQEALDWIIDTISDEEDECWSEMFCETYEYPMERCSGCPNHSRVIDKDYGFPLKKISAEGVTIIVPVKLQQYFESHKEMILLKNEKTVTELVDFLVENDQAVFVDCSDEQQLLEFESMVDIYTFNDLSQFIKKKDHYYIAGLLIVYIPNTKDAFSKFATMKNKLQYCNDIKVIYLTEEDYCNDGQEHQISDYIDGFIKTFEEF